MNSDRRPGERPAGSYNASWSTPGMNFQSKTGTWTTEEIGDREFVSGGILGFEITADGYAPHLDRRVAAQLDPDPAGFTIRMERASTVRGSVLVAATGAPVANATVRITTADRPLHFVGNWYENNAITARTDAKGQFSITNAPTGKLSLRVEHLDHPWHLDGPFPVQSGETADRVIQLPSGGTLTGTTPSPGKVHLHSIGSAIAPDLHAEVQTDAAGGFSFPQVLAPGEYLVFATRSGEGGPTLWLEAKASIRRGKRQKVQLRSLGRESGGFRCRPGGPSKKGRFRPSGEGPWIEVPLRKGVFEVHGLTPGRYEVRSVSTVRVKAGDIVELTKK